MPAVPSVTSQPDLTTDYALQGATLEERPEVAAGIKHCCTSPSVSWCACQTSKLISSMLPHSIQGVYDLLKAQLGLRTRSLKDRLSP